MKMGVKMDGWVWGLEFGPVYFLHRMDAIVPCTRHKTLSNG
jgi:hypothetical protein